MPEVCEVALTALYLNDKLKNMKLKKVEILGGRYKRNHPSWFDDLNSNLPLTLKEIDSKGKQMWFKFKNNTYMMSHFGMEGRWSFKKDHHANIKLTLKKGTKETFLYFVDHRNFGRLDYLDKESDFNDSKDSIGPDFLKEDFSSQDLKDRMEKYMYRKGKIVKSRKEKPILKVLMEGQKKSDGIGSGIGNYLAAEILYRAKIAPTTTVYKIYESNNALKDLTDSIKFVIKASYLTNKTGYIEHIKEYASKIREKIKSGKAPNYHSSVDIGDKEFCFKVYRKNKDPLGNKVLRGKVIKSRTIYWVPTVQTF